MYKRQVLALNEKLVQFDGTKPFVEIKVGPDKFERRDISVGISDGIKIEVKDGVDAIINLGAGLDARPYRLNLPENLEWIEVDHPNIIAHKNETLKLERPKCKLTRIQLDLADRQKRKTFFDSAVPHAEKVLILTEGVIVYLSPEQVAEISNDLSAQPRFKYWVAEYLHPRVYRHLKNPAHAKKMKNAPFKFFPDDWFGYFKNLGWIEKETRCSGEIATEFKRKQPMPIWAALLMAILPKKTKEKSFRVAGYVIFKRG